MDRKEFVMPPSWCAPMCRNAMNEACLEDCAIKRNCEWFEPKQGLNIEDMPAFPMREWLGEMTKDERAVSTTFYLYKIVASLQGQVESPRPYLDNPRMRRFLENIQSQGLQPGAERGAADNQDREKRPGQGNGSASVD